VGRIKIEFVKGKPITLVTDGKWRSSDKASTGWIGAKFDDSSWPKAMVLGPLNTGAWKSQVGFAGSGSIVDVNRKIEPVSAEDARKMIESDWMHQAGGSPTTERSLQEIIWTRKLAKRITAADNKLNFQTELAELSKLEAKLNDSGLDEDGELYFAIRRISGRSCSLIRW